MSFVFHSNEICPIGVNAVDSYETITISSDDISILLELERCYECPRRLENDKA